MPAELETRLERLLTEHPQPTSAAQEQAREAALAALPPLRRRSRPAAWLILAAAGIGVITAGVALAASPGGFRDLRDVVVPSSHHTPRVKTHVPVVRLPRDAAGFTAQIDDRLWVDTPRGLTLRGVPLAAAATSPQALYAVGERAGRLQAVSIADRHIAWSVPLDGRLAAASWSPYPIRIAYVVQHPGGSGQLHVIWGNGVNDQAIGPAAPLMPTWRWDSLAVAYVAPGGAVMLDTVGSSAPKLINKASACGSYRVTGVAFAPDSPTLAETTDGPRVILADTRHPGNVTCIHTAAPAAQLRWLSPSNLLYSHPGSDQLTRIALNHRHVTARGTVLAPGPILSLATAPDGATITVAVRDGSRVRFVIASPPRLGATGTLQSRALLSLAPAVGRVVRIGWS